MSWWNTHNGTKWRLFKNKKCLFQFKKAILVLKFIQKLRKHVNTMLRESRKNDFLKKINDF